MFCCKCGKPITDGSNFCPNCGASQNTASSPNTNSATKINVVVNQEPFNALGYAPKRKWTAFWLCLFFGLFGAHRFYVGKWPSGFLWLMTVGVGTLGWFSDLFKILFNGFRDSHGMPLV